jgi:hypothetical protein
LEDLEAELERKEEREKRLAEAVHWDKGIERSTQL